MPVSEMFEYQSKNYATVEADGLPKPQQLELFLREGWELIAIFPLGEHVVLYFKSVSPFSILGGRQIG